MRTTLLFLICVGAGLISTAAAWSPVPSRLDTGQPVEPVAIGTAADYKDYFPIDAGARLALLGPGTLRFFVRAHVGTGAAPESVWVSLTGGAGFTAIRSSMAVSAESTARYSDPAATGTPSSGMEFTAAVPEGTNDLTITASSDTGGPVYAIFYYDGPQAAPPSAVEAVAPAVELTAGAGLQLIYDDNICRFSDAIIDEFRSGIDPEGYAINTIDDVIISPSIDCELSRPLLFAQRTRLQVSYTTWQYMRNSIKANEEIGLRLRQHTRPSDYIEATYVYAPHNYIKELTDRPPFTSRTVEREYEHFYIARNQFSLGYYWSAMSLLRLRAEVGRILRFYNRPFLENDLWEWNGELTGYIYWKRLQAQVAYRYSDVNARGYDSVGETLETADEESDGSYEKDSYRLRLAYRPKRSAYRPAGPASGVLGAIGDFAQAVGAQIDRRLVAISTAGIFAEVSYARQFYTSQLPLHLDPLHVGRLDETKQLRLGWDSRPLYHNVSLGLEWRYTVRTADAPAGLIGEDDPSEEKDYTGNRFTLTLSYPLK